MLDQMMKMLEGQQIGPYRLNKFLGAGCRGLPPLSIYKVGLRNETQPNYLKVLGFTIVQPNLRSTALKHNI
ncbi:hypothetical protein MiTe_02047 [Microcystis aeruginosa NIES-2520]|jgi:hypothetical protein|uniref:Uncharacterized protein n=1 Tax=Microcystis aeruginosa NIES-2520 TaxID=2303982 RepID=A0A5A5RSA4_MICAE|nr:hypothetical protein MiTe_02047 [Microcystis aeruginosa NIES-2520]